MTTTPQFTRAVLLNFCTEFIDHPYLAYTEHGIQARFFERLYSALPSQDRYTTYGGQRLGVVQTEYPMAACLGKSKRAHWDVSLISTPLNPPNRPQAFDFLRLAAVTEFGLNAGADHLLDDIDRLSHVEANINQCFVFHAYRISPATNKFSRRDKTPKSVICTPNQVQAALGNRNVEVFHLVADTTGSIDSGLWTITSNQITRVV